MKTATNDTLPQIYLITGGLTDTKEQFLARLKKCLSDGIRLVQLRDNTLQPEQYKILAQESLQLCKQYDAKLILNTDLSSFDHNADGTHLNSSRLMNCTNRPLDKTKLVSAACHDEKELQHAQNIGVDFATLSPVFSTISHPGANPLGWDMFSALAALVDIPIYALGGMEPRHIPTAQLYGAIGIATISSIWAPEDG